MKFVLAKYAEEAESQKREAGNRKPDSLNRRWRGFQSKLA